MCGCTVILRERPIHIIFGFLAAILDFRLREASEKVGIGTVEKLAPENRGVAAGVLFISSVELEKPLGSNFTPLVVTNVCKK